MEYHSALQFLQRILDKCRIPSREVDEQQALALLSPADRLSAPEETEMLQRALGDMAERTLYKYTDRLLCSYVFLRLPAEHFRMLLIGPYLAVELSETELMEQLEAAGVPAQRFAQVRSSFTAMPVVVDERVLFAPVQVFCEQLWDGEQGYTMTDVNRELSPWLPDPTMALPQRSVEDTQQQMRLMEERYRFENELIQAVSQGLTQKVDTLLGGFGVTNFERRLSDPVREVKNYSIIMNTLLRKAAEEGGVHPLYIHNMSSDFARRIEALDGIDGARRLMTDMFHSYCRLVKKHSTKQFSPPVQKAVLHIDAGLAGELSLKSLAERQNINASYLSTLFKKETGMTVTDYVNQKRMALASQILGSTKLQIQTVAQHCGISDVNYFSKIFKKYVGMTPKEYRRSLQTARRGSGV